MNNVVTKDITYTDISDHARELFRDTTDITKDISKTLRDLLINDDIDLEKELLIPRLLLRDEAFLPDKVIKEVVLLISKLNPEQTSIISDDYNIMVTSHRWESEMKVIEKQKNYLWNRETSQGKWYIFTKHMSII